MLDYDTTPSDEYTATAFEVFLGGMFLFCLMALLHVAEVWCNKPLPSVQGRTHDQETTRYVRETN